MEARSVSIFLLVWMLSGSLQAQELAAGERAGLLQATGTLYPAFMLNHKVQNNYVGGHTSYYFDDRFSFRGDVLIYIDAQSEAKYINEHIESTAGFGWHFGKKRWDPYLCAQVGLAGIQVEGSDQTDYQPVAGLAFGVNYHVAPYFYFYAETLLRHMNDPLRKGNLDQLLVTGGLGFQFPTRRK